MVCTPFASLRRPPGLSPFWLSNSSQQMGIYARLRLPCPLQYRFRSSSRSKHACLYSGPPTVPFRPCKRLFPGRVKITKSFIWYTRQENEARRPSRRCRCIVCRAGHDPQRKMSQRKSGHHRRVVRRPMLPTIVQRPPSWRSREPIDGKGKIEMKSDLPTQPSIEDSNVS